MDEIINWQPSKVPDKELINDHRLLHAFMSSALINPRFRFRPKDIQAAHDRALVEIVDRGFTHYVRADMDRESAKKLSDDAILKMHQHMSGLSPAKADATVYAATRSLLQREIDRRDLSLTKALRPFKPAKPASRIYSLDELDKIPFERMLVQAKFDGIRTIVVKSGDSVRAFTEDNLYDKTANLKLQLDELKHIPGNFILDAEAMYKSGNKFSYRTEVASYMLSTTPDLERMQNIVLYVFDILHRDTEDLRLVSQEERIKRLSDFKSSPHVRFLTGANTLGSVVKGGSKELRDAVEKWSKAPGSEGVMFKDLTATYPEGTQNKGWIKFKTEHEIDVIVFEKRTISDKAGKAIGTFTYAGAIGPISKETANTIEKDVPQLSTWIKLERTGKGNPDIPNAIYMDGEFWMTVGRLFNTDEDLAFGDIVRVSVQNVLTETVDGVTKFSIFLPRLIEVKDDKSNPDTVAVAARLVNVTLPAETKPVEKSLPTPISVVLEPYTVVLVAL